MLKSYAVVLKGNHGFESNTVVEINSINTEKGTAYVQRIGCTDQVEINLDNAIACEKVSKLNTDTEHLKKGDLFFEVSFNEDTGEVTGYDINGCEIVVSIMDVADEVEEVDEEEEEHLIDEHSIILTDEQLLVLTCQGLYKTALEKFVVSGEDALIDVEAIKKVHHDIVNFWELDNTLIEDFDNMEAECKEDL